MRKAKPTKLPGVRAWTWKDSRGLYRWTVPHRSQLHVEASGDVKIVCVRIVEQSELRELLK